MKKVFSIMLTLLFVFALVACEKPCTEHVDENEDYICDVCEKELEKENPDEEYEIKITSVKAPESMRKWEANKAEQTNKKAEFYDREQEYVVGDDNGFIVKPVVTFVKVDKKTGATLPAIINEWEYIIKVSVKNEEGQYVPLGLENEYVESIDTKNCTIDFAEAALGKYFQVEVYPDKLSEEQTKELSKYTQTLKFKVIEGYNAYTALDLAYIDNRQIAEVSEEDKEHDKKLASIAAWEEFKEEKGLSLEFMPSSIIMHNDIEITNQDLPAYFFYTKDEVSPLDADYNRVVGSMKDYEDMYQRVIGENEEFKLIGNYFKLDCSALSVVVRESGKITAEGRAISHSQLFRFDGHAEGDALIENIRVVGNAGRTENELLAGGVIFVKGSGVDVEVYNNITINTFVHYFSERNEGPVTSTVVINKCKAYDAFNTLVYNFGAEVIIKDSELIGAGGPVIIQDHTRHSDVEDSAPAYTTVINSKLESFVTGSEGWFKITGADAVMPSIIQLSAIFNMVGRTYAVSNGETGEAKLNFVNLICVNKSGDAQSLTAQKIEGTLVIDDVYFDYGAKNNPVLKAVLDQTFSLGAPTFQSSAATVESGYGYFDGKGLNDATGTPIADPNNSIFQGDKICLYHMGMAIVMGYYPADYVYNAK